MMRLAACVSIIVPILLIGVSDALSQGLLDRLIDKTTDSVQRKAQDRVNQRIDQSVDKAINKTEETVKCVATDLDCIKAVKEADRKV